MQVVFILMFKYFLNYNLCLLVKIYIINCEWHLTDRKIIFYTNIEWKIIILYKIWLCFWFHMNNQRKRQLGDYSEETVTHHNTFHSQLPSYCGPKSYDLGPLAPFYFIVVPFSCPVQEPAINA